MHVQTIRTTVTLPSDLVEAADRAVREGRARSRNDLLVAALRRELAAQERDEIDAAFATMSGDRELQEEAVALAEESLRSGWEALRRAEADS